MSATKRKPVLGETLIRVSTGNLVRAGREKEILEVRVTSVGRKYFDTEVVADEKVGKHHYARKVTHCISDWRQRMDYCQNWILYESMQEFLDIAEGDKIRGVLQDVFGPWGRKRPLTIAQLRRIKGIVEEGEQE